MRDTAFSKRLARELPDWQAQGWISAAGADAIRADLARRQARPQWAGILTLCGALLLGVGVILWFAAHWDSMGKLAKLVLIAVGLGASHAGYTVSQSRGLPKLAQGLILLSVLLFGAAIMLVGQIYHINAHYPDGIALWAAGALLSAALLASQPALGVSLLLAALWTWFEQSEYRVLNVPMAVYLALSAIVLWRQTWPRAVRLWGGLLLWWLLLWHMLNGLSDAGHLRLALLQLMGVAALWAWTQASRHPFAQPLRANMQLATLAGAFLFTFPDFYRTGGVLALPTAPWWLALSVLLALYGCAVLLWLRKAPWPPRLTQWARALAVLFAGLLLASFVWTPAGSVLPILWNGLFLGLLYGLGELSLRAGAREGLNVAFVGFALWVLARYIDTFWSLLDRSLFFMAGGLILLLGGAWLERRRRALLGDLDKETAR